jgi:hypothetical protein
MLLNGNEFFLGRIRISLFSLGFIEEVQLTFDIVVSLFAGFAKEFLGKKVDLFLENLLALDMFFFALIGGFEQRYKTVYLIALFFYGIFELYKLTIP